MEIDVYEHGVPSWVDLNTPDPARAREFYSALFGWDTQEGPPEAGGYTIAQLRGKPVAGIMGQMQPGPAVWSTYVNVDDADTIAKAVEANGGSVMVPPMDIMDVGRMAFFTDPTGAAFGIWQPRAHKGAGIVNEVNAYSWNELVTTDVPGAKAFYGAVFGWGAETHEGGMPGGYTEWKLSGRSIGGMMVKPPMMPAEAPPFWAVYFTVEDTDKAAARIAELGGSIVMPPMDIEPGRFAVCADPTGAMFNIITLAAPA